MALFEKQLIVKESSLPGSGKGLFTLTAIPKGSRIVEYKGRITTWKEVKHQSDNGYIYAINRNHVIDAQNHLKALARYANDARGIVRVKGVSNNCVYVNDGLKVYIEAIKDIPAGGEILVDYGQEYWEVTRLNRKLEKQKTAEARTSAPRKQTPQKRGAKKTGTPKKGTPKTKTTQSASRETGPKKSEATKTPIKKKTTAKGKRAKRPGRK